MPVQRTILGLLFEAIAPSFYRMVLPPTPGHQVTVDVSYIDNQEWAQFVELDGDVSCRVYSSLDDAVRPLAIAFGTV